MNDPRLYILMRTDLASMNPGKGMAQAAHAANAFVDAMYALSDVERNAKNDAGFAHWREQTSQGFGTTLTLAISNESDMFTLVDAAQTFNYPANVVLDPTYPVRDGSVTHLLPIYTCAYVFSPDGSPWFLSALPLHP